MAIRTLKSKKGMFFTLLAIILVVLFVLVFSGSDTKMSHYNSDESTQKTKVVNAYVDNLKNTLMPRILVHSSNIAIWEMLYFIDETQAPLANANATFNELLLLGSIDGTFRENMTNITLYNWSNQIKRSALDGLGIKVNLNYSRPSIKQEDAWSVLVSFNYNLTVEKDNIYYKINDTITENISIQGYFDPIALMHGGYKRPISQTNISNFHDDPDNFTNQFATYAHFRSSQNSPSFLMRLVEDSTTDTSGFISYHGIESLVNDSYGDLPYSSVDYLFFTERNSSNPDTPNANLFTHSDITDIMGTTNFKIDLGHSDLYIPGSMALVQWTP